MSSIKNEKKLTKRSKTIQNLPLKLDNSESSEINVEEYQIRI